MEIKKFKFTCRQVTEFAGKPRKPGDVLFVLAGDENDIKKFFYSLDSWGSWELAPFEDKTAQADGKK